MTLNSYILNLEPTNTYKQIRSWEARTRHRRCRTRVRLGGTRRRAGDAAARASGRVGPRGSHVGFFDARRREPIRADSGLNRPESAGIGRNRPVSAETAETADSGRNSKKKKKKKKPRTHRLLNSNPTSAQMHSKRQKHSSHYISLTLNLVYVCIM